MEALAAHAARQAAAATNAVGAAGAYDPTLPEAALTDAMTLLLRVLEREGSDAGSSDAPCPTPHPGPAAAAVGALPAVVRWAHARRRPSRRLADPTLLGPTPAAGAALDFRCATTKLSHTNRGIMSIG